MKKSEVCDLIKQVGIIPSIRVASGDDAHHAAEAIESGGIPLVEITMSVPGAVDLIAHLVRFHPKMLVGAGTVFDAETARRCIDAGASYLTGPCLDLDLMNYAAKSEVAVLSGALTPTEVVAAWRAGSDFVKIFPCALVGGAKYIKALTTSLPQIPLIAAGGVNQQTAADFILSGALAIGVGTELIPEEAIEKHQWKRIKELSRRFSGFVKEARELVAKRRENAVVHEFSGSEKCEPHEHTGKGH